MAAAAAAAPAATPELAQAPQSPGSKEKENEKEPASPKPLSFSAGADPGDPRMVLSRKNVAAAKADTSGRVYRLYCDGIFDLFHVGHMRMLEQAKKAFGDPNRVHLIAGVNTDVDTHKFKGKTVMNHRTRCDSVHHCKWVDEVVEDAPWIVDATFIAKHNIDFVCHDALPYKDVSGQSEDGDVYSGLKKMGKFLETQRTEGISTSDLIIAILKDYDDYVRRNLSRGYTAKELGVGNTWAIRAAAHDKKKTVDTKIEKAKTEAKGLSVAAREFVDQFNPKWLAHREGSGMEIRFTPKTYFQHLQLLPAKSSDLLHHGFGFAKALFDAGYHVASYLIPCCYCGFLCGKQKKT